MKQLRPILILVAALVCPALLAGTDFSGTWRLNAEDSDFGMFPAPEKMTYHISHETSKLIVAWDFTGSRGEMNGKATYCTDGTEVTNTFGKLALTSRAHWDGDVLKVKMWGNSGGESFVFKDTFTLETPSRLRVKRFVDGPGGTVKQIMVFDRISN